MEEEEEEENEKVQRGKEKKITKARMRHAENNLKKGENPLAKQKKKNPPLRRQETNKTKTRVLRQIS